MTSLAYRMKKYTVLGGIIAAITLAVPGYATDLKSELTVSDRMITIGDLFDNAGDKADIIVFEAPAPGKSKSISARDLERIAEKHELEWERPDYLKRVSLTRLSSSISNDDLMAFIHESAISAGASPDSQVRLFGRNNGLLVPVDADVTDLTFEQFSLNDKQDRFTGVLLVPSGGDSAKKMSMSGMLEEVRDIPVLNRSILPGETITIEDISWIQYPSSRLGNRAILSQQQLVGMTVRRAVRPEKPINTNDVMEPILVEKGSAVTMVVRSGPIILTASGRALENGGLGDTIRILNAKSRLTVDAKVVSAGQVEISSGPSLALGSR